MRVKIFNKKLLTKKNKLTRKVIAGALVLMVPLSSVLGLSSCSKTKNVEKTNSYNVEVSVVDPTILMEEDDYKEATTTNTKITIDDSNLKEFTSYLDNINTEYSYSDLWEIDDALDKENDYESILMHYKDIRDASGKITLENLFNTVLKNNDEFYQNLGSMKAFYTQMDDEYIKGVCEIIVQVINDFADKENIDMNRVSCFLADLKIFEKTGSSLASVSRDGVLSVNPNMIKVGTVINDGKDAEENVLVHEIIHIIQSDCLECDKIYKQGTSIKNNNLQINPMYNSWLVEASAEKEMTKYTGNKNFTYQNQINYMESIAFALTLNENYKVGEIEDLSLMQDYNKLYSLFNIPQDEVIKMLYTIEIIQSEPKEFKSVYESTYNEEITDDVLIEIKRELKSSFAISLSKVFYGNLANRINEGNVTLEDAFYLIKIFESDMFLHLRYDNTEKLEPSMYYINTYNELQEKFFSLIASNDLSYEDICSYYQEYSMRTINNNVECDANYSLNWLESDKQEYIEERKEDVYTKNAINPYNYLTLTTQKNYN